MKKWQLVSIACLMAVLGYLSCAYAQGGQFKMVGVEQVKKMMDSGERMVVVDARTEEEYERGHLPGAINIGPKRFPYIAGFLPKDKAYPVLFYCRGYG